MKSKGSLFQRLGKQVAFIFVVYGVIVALASLGVFNDYVTTVLTTASINMIVALGLNLVTGMSGQLVLGHAGFMAVGAYGTAIMLKAGFPMFPALVLASLFTALVGLIFGSMALKLRGDYLAIVTLGFGEIIRVVLNNLDKLTGGAAGMMGIPSIANFLGNQTLSNFVWVSLFMVLAILALAHLLTSSHGRAILSVRDDEIAAEAMGINVYYTKVYAFTLSTLLAGIAGSLFAGHYGYLNPGSFTFLKSMDFLVIVVFGGLGSLTGTVTAGFVVVLLQETVLRNLPTIPIDLGGVQFPLELSSYRLVIYPLLLILMMIFRPQGLLGTRELALTDTLLSARWWKRQIARLGERRAAKGGNDNAHS